MKKVAFGCLIILGLMVVAVGGVMTWGYFKVSGMVGQVQERAAVIQDIQENAPSNPNFQPPTDGLISDQQVAKLVAVEQYIQGEMEPVLAQHNARVEEIKALTEGNNSSGADLSEMFNVFQHLDELADVVTSYKRIQVEALQQQDLSFQEYSWARTLAIRSFADFRGQLDLEQLEQFNIGDFEELTQNSDIKPENTEKLAEHRDLLAETLPWLLVDTVVTGLANEANSE